MNCSRFETLLSDYWDAQLDERVRLAAKQHLDSCASCSELLKAVSDLRDELNHFPEVSLRDELVDRILERTTGKPAQVGFWQDLVIPALRPLMTQRYAFATLMMFVFLSFAVNIMGPGFSAFSYTNLTPSALVARADQFTEQVYRRWHEFNDFKVRVSEEIKLFKEDLLGRLDYHLVALLFRSYTESLQEEEKDPETTKSESEEEEKNE